MTASPSAPPADPACRVRPGVEVTELPDVAIPAVVVAPQHTVDIEIGGEVVAGTTVEGFTIPAQVADAGCIVMHDAPGGCAGAVDVSAATIPAVTIPGVEIAAVDLPDGTRLEAIEIDAVTVPAVSAPAVRTEQVCQIEAGSGIPTVTRRGVVRPGISRPGASRPGRTRPGRCVEERCVPDLVVDAVDVEAVRLPDVDIEPVRLQRQEVRDDVEVFAGDGRTSFVIRDVLFDTDSATIRPGAEAPLRSIADLLGEADDGGAILVEGHTDDRADDGYNLDLSRQRAQAVADWLVANAGIDPARMEVIGRGESAPASPNDTAEGQQRNRRVVVSIGS